MKKTYQTPKVKSVEIKAQSLVCASAQTEQLSEENFEW